MDCPSSQYASYDTLLLLQTQKEGEIPMLPPGVSPVTL